ncbi:MAG: hypothetical protein JWP01_3180 [Myxococcales bacterium]|nr:hypothetical protein [Myxococcales bacterium]
MAREIVITGRAYQRAATLSVTGATLTWRATRGADQPENIATTVHDVRDVTWLEKRWSLGAVLLAVLSVVWMYEGPPYIGVALLLVAAGLGLWRWLHPRYWLGLDLGERWLVLRVEDSAADAARTLSQRVRRQLVTGEVPAIPPTLP